MSEGVLCQPQINEFGSLSDNKSWIEAFAALKTYYFLFFFSGKWFSLHKGLWAYSAWSAFAGLSWMLAQSGLTGVEPGSCSWLDSPFVFILEPCWPFVTSQGMIGCFTLVENWSDGGCGDLVLESIWRAQIEIDRVEQGSTRTHWGRPCSGLNWQAGPQVSLWLHTPVWL